MVDISVFIVFHHLIQQTMNGSLLQSKPMIANEISIPMPTTPLYSELRNLRAINGELRHIMIMI